MPKHIFFDMDTTALLSEDGRARPFMDIILEYCYVNKIVVSLMVSPAKARRAETFYNVFDKDKHPFIASPMVVSKGGGILDYPTLVISCDSTYLEKYPGLLIPPYDPDRTNRFAELAFAGTLLETIKNRVVLNRQRPEREITTPEPEKPKEDSGGEDFSSWAYTV